MSAEPNGLRSATLAAVIELGGRRLRNRIIGAPMERNLSTPSGSVTDAYVDYLEARAIGGAALLFTEAAYVRADGKGRARQMGIHDDAVIDPLRRLAEAVQRHDTLLGVELNHGGRTAQAVVSGFRCVAPSPVPCHVVGGEIPLELETEEIEDLIESYAVAARRCVTAGVDVISIHAAHGYLIHQFMSPLTNLRGDRWADPTLFLNRVIVAVRDAAPEIVLGVRLSAIEGPPGGLDADATYGLIEQAPLDRLDFLDISAGSYEAGEWIVQPGEWEEGLLAPYAKRYRALGLPVSVAGRISLRETAERIIAGGSADMVSVARALHADPGWAGAVVEGRRYRPCIACNLCIDELKTGDPVPCSVNPNLGHEVTSNVGGSTPWHGRVVVVGAGPAGLEAARRLASFGAGVVLFEREPVVGGQFRLASRLHEYPAYHRILDWYEEELERLGVDLRLGVEASISDFARLDPEAVVVATGAEGVLPSIPGIDDPRVVEVRAWLTQGSPDLGGGAHIVWGADREGVAVADELASRGKSVVIVGAQEALAPDVGRRAKILVVPRLGAHPDVEMHLGVQVVGITADTIVLRGDDGERELEAPGPILVSQGLTPRSDLVRLLREAQPSLQLEVVGDAGGDGAYMATAVAAGARAAVRLSGAREREVRT